MCFNVAAGSFLFFFHWLLDRRGAWDFEQLGDRPMFVVSCIYALALGKATFTIFTNVELLRSGYRNAYLAASLGTGLARLLTLVTVFVWARWQLAHRRPLGRTR